MLTELRDAGHAASTISPVSQLFLRRGKNQVSCIPFFSTSAVATLFKVGGGVSITAPSPPSPHHFPKTLHGCCGVFLCSSPDTSPKPLAVPAVHLSAAVSPPPLGSPRFLQNFPHLRRGQVRNTETPPLPSLLHSLAAALGRLRLAQDCYIRHLLRK